MIRTDASSARSTGPTGRSTGTGRPTGRSFLKWAGGKTRYAATIVSAAPPFTGTYREPFLGSGAVFFELAPERAVLSDANPELIVCFQVVAADPAAVMRLLDEQPNTAEHFAAMRRRSPADCSDLERAVRVVYLNKTAFRGLWRVNRRGEFNTPYGAYDRPYYDRRVLLDAARTLRRAELRTGDFVDELDAAQAGDWVYLDPPYVPLGGWADFKRYTSAQFGPHDHVRLRDAMVRAAGRGVWLTLTNSDTPFVRDLFGPDFSIARMATRRDINLQAANRRSWDLLITNYELPVPVGPPG
ncbi:Dam family site-specific DNA-(adenine-N6)-methyltransferase [Solwaraspora sp. WMMA2056]|uniref:DNA adenine methylase n=1 Tax=Solwaraspora sp. WMMA2056 TaxID=3015161 RepID=UPI00259B00B3|nr:Dam family site-specific DNA-(adenine-N6)-methyltransferase [Solwaraspora sp. WMMA2056]WJK41288.1 Dam family site-specific DNA-(adenine-N6)-methyltransferase [Solwaraspora sp. WMMA2056]